MEQLLNCALSPHSWLQSFLPLKSGGLGIRQVVHTAIPCFLASVYACLQHSTSLLPEAISILDVDVEDAKDEWALHFQPAVMPPEEVRRYQDEWEALLFAIALQQLLSAAAASPAKHARVLLAASLESGLWLNALPSPHLGTHLDNESFRIAAALRLDEWHTAARNETTTQRRRNADEIGRASCRERV